MKIIIFIVCLVLMAVPLGAQQVLMPGANEFERSAIKNGRSVMGYHALVDGKMVEIGSFHIDIQSSPQQLAAYTSLRFHNSTEQWSDTMIADPASFTPLYRSSFTSDKEYVLRFGKEITGYYRDKKNNSNQLINEPANGRFFDNSMYPYLLGLLPLQSGYKRDLPVYEFQPGKKNPVHKARIEEVKSSAFVSSLTGEHSVWQVTVLEEATNDKYEYFIGKKDKKIWKIEVRSGAQHVLLVNKEIDHNPFSQPFDKSATMKLISSGTAVISGEAFARDNENEGLLNGKAILNVNKKQYAKPGTTVLLIPYTAFYKEWVKVNEASRKKGRPIPLPAEAAACIKVATVYDNKGHFEFVNLMPGEYLLYTEFGYVHTSHRTEIIGYTDTYINGMFQGSSANTEVNTYRGNAAASIKKIITINKMGEKVQVKLKKTL